MDDTDLVKDKDDALDGEVVAQDISTVQGGEVIINMEGMIKNYIASIDRLTEEHKKHKEMLDDIFNNDLTFKEHSDKAKEAAKVKQTTKAQILKQPQARELDEKVRSLKSEIKEQQDSLSDYLQEYQRLSGVNEIEGEDGQVREIVYVAKLIKRTSGNFN